MTLITAYAFPAMGGTVEVQGAGAEGAARVEALFARHEQIMSRFRPDSELCAVNASAGMWCQPSPTLARALREAVWWMDATDGVFDPTQLDALEAAGYERSWPFAHAASQPLRPRPLARAIELDAARGIRLTEGVRIDLGGIGKGFTVDRAIESLGPGANALVDASGDLYAAGDCPDNRDTGEPGAGWVIGVHDPRTAEVEDIDIALLRVRNRGVATSGSTKRRWSTPAGERYHHLIDARTGPPSTRTCSPSPSSRPLPPPPTCWRRPCTCSAPSADWRSCSSTARTRWRSPPRASC